MKKVFLTLACALIVGITFGVGNKALATAIGPGFDLFETVFPGTFVDLTGVGLSIVPLKGEPIGPGTTDTIIQRKQGIDPFNPPGGAGTIDIELVALSLVSVSPVDLTGLGGPFIGVFSDLFVTVNKEIEDIPAPGGNDDGVCDLGETCKTVPGLPVLDPLDPSIGRMEIRHTNAGGGTFDSCFGDPGDGGVCGALGVAGGGIFADAIFTVVGGDPNNPFDIFFNQPAPRVSLSSVSSTWSHTPPPLDPHNAMFPARDFFVIDIEEDGPHLVGPSVVPEPSTLLLLSSGLAGLGFFRRRKKAA